MDPIEVLRKADSFMPSTLDTEMEKQKWRIDSFANKTAEQIQYESDNTPNFGMTKDNFQHYAADTIQERQLLRSTMGAKPLTGMEQVAISDAYRQMTGEKPLFYEVGEGGAVPRDYFHEATIQNNKNSGWRNFSASGMSSLLGAAGGIRQLGAKISDEVGLTEGSTEYWQSQMEAVEHKLAKQGGVSGMAGEIAGTIVLAALLGGGGKGFTAVAQGGGWKALLANTMKSGLGPGLTFGASETGRRFGEVSARRKDGQDIGTLDSLTYSVGGGLIEAATEAFGWGVAKGVGGKMLRSLPGLRNALAKGGVEAGVKWFNRGIVAPVVSGAIPGATEEVMATFGQNVLDRMTGVVSAEEQGEYGVLSNTKRAALMGAITPALMGVAQTGAQYISPGGKQQVQQQMQAQEEAIKTRPVTKTIEKSLTRDDLSKEFESRKEWVETSDVFSDEIKAATIEAIDAGIEATNNGQLVSSQDQNTALNTLDDGIDTAIGKSMAAAEQVQGQTQGAEPPKKASNNDAVIIEAKKLRKDAIEQLEKHGYSASAHQAVKEADIALSSLNNTDAIISGLETRKEWVQDSNTMPDAAKADAIREIDEQIATVREERLERVPEEVIFKPKNIPEFIAASEMGDPIVHNELPPDERRTLRDTYRDMRRSGVNYTLGQLRTERIMNKLDGDTVGPNNVIYDDVKDGSVSGRQNTDKESNRFIDNLRGLLPSDMANNRAMARYLNTRTDIPGTKKSLTLSQRIGIYRLSKDKSARYHMKHGNKYSDRFMEQVAETITPEEMQIVGMMDEFDQGRLPSLQQAYTTQTGEKLDLEENYASIHVLGKNLDKQDDFFSMLLGEKPAEGKFVKEGSTIKRKEKAAQPIEIDAFANMFASIASQERYKAMLPVVMKHAETINDPAYKEAVDKSLGGDGSKIISKWFADSIRGSSQADHTFLSKSLDALRVRGVTAALGVNVVTSLKQMNSLLIGAAYNKSMIPYTMKNLKNSFRPKDFREMERFVNDRTDLLKDRSMDRDIRRMHDMAKTTDKIARRKSLSEKSMGLIQFMDRHTVYPLWKSYYEVSLDQGMTEPEAIKTANRQITRTQPMANVEDLPHYFRGGTLEKLFTTFQNQVNQNFNYWAHDIVGEYKRGKLSKTEVAYRALMSGILPAVTMAMVSDGFDAPEDTAELTKDILAYPISSLFFFGQMASGIMEGFERSSIADTLPNELTKAARSLTQDNPNWGGVLEHMAKAIGAGAGIPTSQPMRTLTGAKELITGETEDPRRLIWSEYALKKKEPKRHDPFRPR